MPYPDKVLAADEEVVAHLHPHPLTVFWPVVRLLVLVGAASFGMAMIPVGRNQGLFRLLVLAVAVVLLLVSVVGPLLRWRTTHYVITSHRLLHRSGVLTRRGRDIALSRITDVSFTQTLWQRVIRSGTLRITSPGEGATVLDRVPGAERVQTLLNHMVEEDADRRAQESAGYLGEEYRRGGGHATGGWPGAPSGEVHGGPGYVTEWGTVEHRTAMFGTHPVP